MKATYMEGGVLRKVEMLPMRHFGENVAWRSARLEAHGLV